MIYLYGLLRPTCPDLPAAGLGPGVTGPVRIATAAGIPVIHGPPPEGELLPRRKLLLTHARVLESAMDLGTVLPMRFGMTCGSLPEIGALLDARRDAVEDEFRRLSDHVQFGLRIDAPEALALARTLDGQPALVAEHRRLQALGPGAQFQKAEFGRRLGEALAGRRSRAQAAALGLLVPLATEHALLAPETDTQALRAEFLVPRHAIDSFTRRAEAATDACTLAGPGSATARLVGPGPAYHFTRLALTPAETPAAEAV